MNDTTTEERVDTENLVDAAARAAAEASGKTLATLEPEQVKFTEHQVAILRQIGLEDATQGDLDLFFHVCRTTGLDPFRRQIYMIGRNTKVTEWVDDERVQGGRRKTERWVTKYTIQTGIDGFRRNGREAAKAYGDTLTFEGPFWCGEDGQWREVWPSNVVPLAAKYTVFRNGEPFSAITHFDEFTQGNSMWTKMPRNQIGKCAEAMAYRRAYPDDFSGLILEDSAQSTVIDQDGNVESAPKQRPARSGGLRARSQAAAKEAEEPMDVETVDLPTETQTVEPAADREPIAADTAPKGLSDTARQKWQNRMFGLFGSVQCTDREEQLVVIEHITGRDALENRTDITDDELKTVVNKLNVWDKTDVLGAELRKILGDPAEAPPTTEPIQEELQ